MLNATRIFGNVTDTAAIWHAEPQGRGTYSILTSCLTTLSLCAWSAIHVNVDPGDEFGPRRSEPKSWLGRTWNGLGSFFLFFVSKATWRKFGWFSLAILAPEMVFLTAWRQHHYSRKITIQAHEAFQQKPPESRLWTRVKRVFTKKGSQVNRAETVELNEITKTLKNWQERPLWTTTHSFYAIMGGFAVDIGRSHIPFFPRERRYLTITPRGFQFLLNHKPDIIPAITLAQIQDKSKSDTIAKFLVCIQASWFMVQSIYRLVSHLPISLLELNTFSHCICALIIYLVWLEKPLNISQPTLIDDDQIYPVAALMAMLSTLDSVKDSEHVDVAFDVIQRDLGLPVSEDIGFDRTIIQMDLRNLTFKERLRDLPDSSSFLGQILCQRSLESDKAARNPKSREDGLSDESVEASIRERRFLASRALIDLNLLSQEWFFENDQLRIKLNEAQHTFYKHRRSLMADRVSLFRNTGPKEATWSSFLSGIIPLYLAGAFYDGFHLLAWNASFRTRVEQLLWRISATTITSITGPNVVLVILIAIALIVSELGEDVSRSTPGPIRNPKSSILHFVGKVMYWGSVLVGFVLFLSLAALNSIYVFARAYLIIECFLQLPYLPEAAFQVPNWSLYWIHIS